MNHKLFASKFNLFVIGLVLAASIVLVTTNVTRATQWTRLEDLAKIKDAPASDARVIGTSRLAELARIKDDITPVDARLSALSRLKELARIKDDVYPVDTRISGPSRLEKLAGIKER